VNLLYGEEQKSAQVFMSHKPILKLLLRIIGVLLISFAAFCFYTAYWARSLRNFGEASYGSALIVVRYGPIAIPTSAHQAFIMNLNLGIFTLIFGVTLFWFSRAFVYPRPKT
jgi:hypothetical protein